MAYVYTEEQLNELNELSLNSIGIIKKEGGFTGAHTSRILVIGLGGMGLKTIGRLKREVTERLGIIDKNYLQFRVFDTDQLDRNKMIQNGSLIADEIPVLDNTPIQQALQTPVEHRPAEINGVIPTGFNQSLNGQGANQVRLAGRLTVMDSTLFKTIYNSIESAIKGLNNFIETPLDVHVVAGVGGGSGSGLIIDVPYITRAVAAKIGIPEPSVRVFGHIYLPNSYHGIANYNLARRNGYAALKEIDYYMTLDTNGETFDVNYPAPVGRFSSRKPIFTQCTLVGGKSCLPIVIDNPQEKAISVCVEDLVNLCTSVKGNIDPNTQGSISDFFAAGSFHVNTMASLQSMISDPNHPSKFPASGNYNYNLIGAATIKFPTEEIAEQIIGTLSGKAIKTLTQNVEGLQQKDVDEFEASIGISPSALVEEYSVAISRQLDEINSDPDVRWTKNSIQGTQHTTPLKTAVDNAIKAFYEKKDVKEIKIAAANAAAKAIFTDRNKGPYYLEKLLTASSASGASVAGLYEKLSTYPRTLISLKEAYVQNEARHEETARKLIDDMQGFGHFRNNLDTLKDTLKQIYLAKFKAALCEHLQTNYYLDVNRNLGLIYDIVVTLDRNYVGQVEIFDKILNILVVNAGEAERKLSADAQSDPTSILSFTDSEFTALKETVRQECAYKINTLGAEAPINFAAGLASAIISDTEGKWSLTESCRVGESKPAAEFRNFVKNYEPFKAIINSTMIDYFEKAYSHDADKTNMVNRFVATISHNSAPMCNVWPNPYFDFNTVSELCYQYLVLPSSFNNGANGWGSKFGTVFQDHNTNIYWSPDQDAIYSYKLYAKMPLWIHEELTDYENKYTSDKSQGLHINESPSMQPPLKDYPALMIPSQYYRTRSGGIEYTNQFELDQYNKISEIVKKAEAQGIVYKADDGKFCFRVLANKPTESEMISKVRKYIDEQTQSGVVSAEAFIKKLEQEYAFETHNVTGRTGLQSSDIDTFAALMRNHMQNYKKLEDEVKFYDNAIFNPINEANESAAQATLISKLARYAVFGVISSDKGLWSYKLADKRYPILSKLDVMSDEKSAWKSEYMEMAVCDALENSVEFKNHTDLLNNSTNDIHRAILAGDDARFEELKANYAKLKDTCAGHIARVEQIRLRGEEPSPKDIKVSKFYKTMLADVEKVMSMFE